MWKVAQLAAAFVTLAACDSINKDKLKQTKAEAEALAAVYAEQDDAKCQTYSKPGSDAYIQCRKSLQDHRAECARPGVAVKLRCRKAISRSQQPSAFKLTFHSDHSVGPIRPKLSPSFVTL